jgi:hypothetical protein
LCNIRPVWWLVSCNIGWQFWQQLQNAHGHCGVRKKCQNFGVWFIRLICNRLSVLADRTMLTAALNTRDCCGVHKKCQHFGVWCAAARELISGWKMQGRCMRLICNRQSVLAQNL